MIGTVVYKNKGNGKELGKRHFEQLLSNYLLTFFGMVTKCLTRSNSRDEGLILAHSLRAVLVIMTAEAWAQKYEEVVTLCPKSGSREQIRNGTDWL